MANVCLGSRMVTLIIIYNNLISVQFSYYKKLLTVWRSQKTGEWFERMSWGSLGSVVFPA